MSRSLLRILAALTAALLLLGACGGDDDEGAEPAGEETSSPGDDAAADDDSSDDEGDDEGADEGDDDTTTTDDPGDTTTTDGGGTDPNRPNVAAIDDFCEIFTLFNEVDDPFDAVEDAADPEAQAAAFREAFSMMTALFQRATQLAPSAIEGDMALMSQGLDVFNEVMAEYDYDFMALGMASETDPAIQERLEAMESVEFDTAADNVEAFVLADCGIELS